MPDNIIMLFQHCMYAENDSLIYINLTRRTILCLGGPYRPLSEHSVPMVLRHIGGQETMYETQ